MQLEMNSDNDCESDDLSAEVDPAVVQLDSGDTETVEVTVDVLMAVLLKQDIVSSSWLQ